MNDKCEQTQSQALSEIHEVNLSIHPDALARAEMLQRVMDQPGRIVAENPEERRRQQVVQRQL
jgi:hypothetical protein